MVELCPLYSIRLVEFGLFFFRQREAADPNSVQTDPLQIFLEAVENAKPVVGVKAMNRGGKIFQVCMTGYPWFHNILGSNRRLKF